MENEYLFLNKINDDKVVFTSNKEEETFKEEEHDDLPF